jgi:hypothetical protein
VAAPSFGKTVERYRVAHGPQYFIKGRRRGLFYADPACVIDRPVGGAPWLTGFQATAPRAGRSGENLLPEARPAEKIGWWYTPVLPLSVCLSVCLTPIRDF